MPFVILAWFTVTAAAPAQDILALAKAGRMPSFDAVLDARFDPAGKEFTAFRDWATVASPEDRAKLSEQLPRGPDGRTRWRERVACSEADQRGFARAMAVAAGRSADRASARTMWNEVERVFAAAEVLERKKLAEARATSRSTAVGRELAIRLASDQAWREAQYDVPNDDITAEAIGWRFWSRLCHIDNDDTAYMKSVIAKGEWPLISRDGEEAAKAAFLLVQHADQDPDFQKQVLTVMEPLVAKKEALGKHYAALFDRVAFSEHRLQRYGTQFGEGKGGCTAVLPVEDHAGLDARRAAMGLDSLADYAKRLSDAFKQKICDDVFATLETTS